MCCCKKLSEGAAEKFAELDAFIDTLNVDLNDERRRGRLIQVLHKAQEIFGYLPREIQQYVAQKLNLTEAQVSGRRSVLARYSALPPSMMSVPRPAMFVAIVTAPNLPAWATISASFS